MNKNILVLVSVFLIMGGFVLSGCATDGYRSGSTDSYYDDSTQGMQRFEDVPVPAGYVLNRPESFIFQNNKTRMGTMTYVGSGEMTSIIVFFKTNMPKYGWDLLTSVEFNKAVMSYEKDSESCIVTIDRMGMRKVLISISLSPLSNGAVKIEEKREEY